MTCHFREASHFRRTTKSVASISSPLDSKLRKSLNSSARATWHLPCVWRATGHDDARQRKPVRHSGFASDPAGKSPDSADESRLEPLRGMRKAPLSPMVPSAGRLSVLRLHGRSACDVSRPGNGVEARNSPRPRTLALVVAGGGARRVTVARTSRGVARSENPACAGQPAFPERTIAAKR